MTNRMKKEIEKKLNAQGIVAVSFFAIGKKDTSG
jgi:hypothetical protein